MWIGSCAVGDEVSIRVLENGHASEAVRRHETNRETDARHERAYYESLKREYDRDSRR
jgi:hypothetical protein